MCVRHMSSMLEDLLTAFFLPLALRVSIEFRASLTAIAA